MTGPHLTGYTSVFGLPLSPADRISATVAATAGGVASNVYDIAHFQRSLVTGQLLPAGLLKQMETPVPVSVSGSFGYGLGLMSIDTGCGRFVGHQGGIPGYETWALTSLDGRRQLVLEVNTDTASRPATATYNALLAAVVWAACG